MARVLRLCSCGEFGCRVGRLRGEARVREFGRSWLPGLTFCGGGIIGGSRGLLAQLARGLVAAAESLWRASVGRWWIDGWCLWSAGRCRGGAREGRDSPNAYLPGDVRDCGRGFRHHGFGDSVDSAAVLFEHQSGSQPEAAKISRLIGPLGTRVFVVCIV